MNKAEKYIGELCYGNARNKRNAEKYMNRYERMHRDKVMDRAKAARSKRKADKFEMDGELHFDK